MKVDYFDNKGKILAEKFSLDDEIFGIKINKQLLTLSINSFLANQRQSNANTKTRAEVSGGGKKPWKQKGTGRARVGSNRSPLWRGGGVSFGPKTTDNYKVNLSKKMTKAAIKSALSLKTKEGNVVVFQNIDLKNETKTKNFVKIIKNFLNEKVLIVQGENNKELLLSSRNVPNVSLKGVNELNAYAIINTKKIIIIENSLEEINKYWGSEEKPKKTETKKKVIKKEDVKEVKKVSEKKKIVIKKKVVKKTVKKTVKITKKP